MANKDIYEVDGMFIYHDKRGRAIYSNPFMKSGYIINASNTKSYNLYSSRIPFGLIAGIFVYYFTSSFLLGLLAFVIFYGVMSFFFFTKFLPKLTEIENYEKPKKDNFLVRFAKRSSYKGIVAFFIVSEICGSLIIINIHASSYTNIIAYANYVIGIIVMIAGIVSLYAVKIKKDLEKEEQ